MGLLIAYFCLSICFSFLCSIWEAVLLSITPSYVNRQVRDNSSMGRQLEEYKKDIDKPLSAILTLNTIAHTVGAIGVGAQAGKVFGHSQLDLFGFHLTYESLIAGAMTLAILILSEIIPKTIGANNWQSLAPFTMSSLKILLFLLAPFVWLSQLITKSLKKNKHESVLSRADFAAMTDVGEKSGALAESESKIIKNLLHLDRLDAKDVMTPISVAFILDQNLTLDEAYTFNKLKQFSRIPLFNDKPNDITGLILKDDILQELLLNNGSQKLEDHKRSVIIVNNKMTLPALFETLTTGREHMAVVADEFGSVVGVVTLEDVFETILGIEIVDESDSVEDLQELARKKWAERAEKMGILN